MTFTKIQSKKIEMKKNYSVFLGNVGSCSDRYCATYGKSFSTEELFRRVATVPYLTGVDLVLTPELVNDWQTVRRMLDETGLMPISLAVDHFAQAKWKQGAFTSPNLEVRKSAVEDTKRAMDLAAEINCDLVTIWPGQDGMITSFKRIMNRNALGSPMVSAKRANTIKIFVSRWNTRRKNRVTAAILTIPPSRF